MRAASAPARPLQPSRDAAAGRVPLTSARRLMAAVVGLSGVAIAFVAVTVPFHATDALIYGRWARLIGITGDLHFAGIGSGYLHRPLVYVVEGWLWRAFGFHEWIGRLWVLAFAAVLVWAVWRLAAADRGGAFAGALAAVLLVVTPDVVSLAASNLTDVPVAAMVALAGTLVLTPWGGRARPVLIVVAAALAGLAKPSAFIALAGLGAALLLGPRADLRRRIVRDVAPLAAGGVLALVWDAVQASRLDVPLTTFLQGADSQLSAGVVDYYAQLSAQSRASFIAGMEWLGPYLVLPLLFGLLYGAQRALGRGHRGSATVAAPVAFAGSWLLPLLADGSVGPWSLHRPAAAAGTIVLAIPLWLARDCPEQEAPTRLHLARMLVWAIPPTVAWIVSAPFQTRYLSPAWAPLFVLLAAALWPAVRGTAARRPRAAWVVVAVLCVLAVLDLRNIDGLGSRPDGSIDAARTIRALGVTGWFDPAEARRAADPSLAALHDAAGAALARRPGRLVSSDGRLGFWWPERVVRAEPQTCAAVRPFSVLVVTESATGLDPARERALTARERAQATGGHATDPAFWRRCPGVTALRSVPGQFTVFGT